MELLGCLHYPLQHSVKGYFFFPVLQKNICLRSFKDQAPKIDVLEEIVVIRFVLEYCPRGVTVGFAHAACVCVVVWWLLAVTL